MISIKNYKELNSARKKENKETRSVMQKENENTRDVLQELIVILKDLNTQKMKNNENGTIEILAKFDKHKEEVIAA